MAYVTRCRVMLPLISFKTMNDIVTDIQIDT